MAAKFEKTILKQKDAIEKSNSLNDAEFDAEALLEEGYSKFALIVLKEISEINNSKCSGFVGAFFSCRTLYFMTIFVPGHF